MINTLIIEDHSVVRMGVKMIVSDLLPEAVFQEADSFPEGMKIIENDPIDLIILDIVIPGGLGSKMISSIREFAPNSIILIFSGLEESKHALRYIEAGANGFLPKQSSQQEFRKALNMILKKEKYISIPLQQHLINHLSERKPLETITSWRGLSKRETEIAKFLIEGRWTKEIAQLLNLKESTISTFKRRIFQKTGVANSIELAQIYENDHGYSLPYTSERPS